MHGARLLWQAEQLRLLPRLTADSGARRGELAGLRLSDLDGRELQIVRAISAEQVTTTKTGRARRLTLGASTARFRQDTVDGWQQRRPDLTSGPWLSTSYATPDVRMTIGALGAGLPTSPAGTATATSRCTACATQSRRSWSVWAGS